MGIEANGGSLQEVFRNAAKGLISIIAGNSKIDLSQKKDVFVPSIDIENLMVRWLTEILYLFETEKFLTGNAEFELLNESSLKATLSGEPYNPEKHELQIDVKAVTYHKIKVVEKGGEWTACIYVDI